MQILSFLFYKLHVTSSRHFLLSYQPLSVTDLPQAILFTKSGVCWNFGQLVFFSPFLDGPLMPCEPQSITPLAPLIFTSPRTVQLWPSYVPFFSPCSWESFLRVYDESFHLGKCLSDYHFWALIGLSFSVAALCCSIAEVKWNVCVWMVQVTGNQFMCTLLASQPKISWRSC